MFYKKNTCVFYFIVDKITLIIRETCVKNLYFSRYLLK